MYSRARTVASDSADVDRQNEAGVEKFRFFQILLLSRRYLSRFRPLVRALIKQTETGNQTLNDSSLISTAAAFPKKNIGYPGVADILISERVFRASSIIDTRYRRLKNPLFVCLA